MHCEAEKSEINIRRKWQWWYSDILQKLAINVIVRMKDALVKHLLSVFNHFRVPVDANQSLIKDNTIYILKMYPKRQCGEEKHNRFHLPVWLSSIFGSLHWGKWRQREQIFIAFHCFAMAVKWKDKRQHFLQDSRSIHSDGHHSIPLQWKTMCA